jgi:hypothetical protein
LYRKIGIQGGQGMQRRQEKNHQYNKQRIVISHHWECKLSMSLGGAIWVPMDQQQRQRRRSH